MLSLVVLTKLVYENIKSRKHLSFMNVCQKENTNIFYSFSAALKTIELVLLFSKLDTTLTIHFQPYVYNFKVYCRY